MGEIWARYATAIGRRTAARLARLAAPPPPTLSAPRPTAMDTMAAQARFFTWVRGRGRGSRVRVAGFGLGLA